ncbi:MAG TPA: pectate lyase [Polyangiales bacterium]
MNPPAVDGGAASDAASGSRATDAAGPGDATLTWDSGTRAEDASPPRSDASNSDSNATGDCAQDPREALRALAPKDADLAKDFSSYLASELGELDCRTGGQGGARTLTRPIFVPANVTYDGRGERLTADVAAMRCDTSEGEQAEHQRPFFVLAPGAQLHNVTFAFPGCEGVHLLGDNVLDHVVWEDAGEDAASVRSYFPGGRITIRNSEGHKAADKMFQFNAPCDVRIENFRGSDMGKLVRQNGGTEFKLSIDLNMVTITGVISAVVQSDSPLCFVRYHALSYAFTGSEDKADRVFRDIPPANVTQY